MPQLTAAGLKAWRLSQGLSQAEVAERLAISRSHYTNIELGRKPLTPRLLRQLDDAWPELAANRQKTGG